MHMVTSLATFPILPGRLIPKIMNGSYIYILEAMLIDSLIQQSMVDQELAISLLPPMETVVTLTMSC